MVTRQMGLCRIALRSPTLGVATVMAMLLAGCSPGAPAPSDESAEQSGLSASTRPGTAPSQRGTVNLLLITLDTLRADRLGSYGHAAAQTPHLDRLAARGARFSQATTVTPLTLPAHSSLMTGTFPVYHGVRDNGGYYLDDTHQTLAEILQQAGWRTGGFVGAFVLDARWGIAQGFEHFFDDFDLTRFDNAASMDAIQRPGNEVVDRALAWLTADGDTVGEKPSRQAPRDQPFFAWVHLYDPHAPYAAPEPYRSRFPATRSGAYDAEIAATDAQVGRLLDHLEQTGQLDDTLVIVLGDHGEMLGEHGEITHGFFVYEAATRIPLIVAGPGIAPRVVDQQVRMVDVLPTILARLRLASPEAVQGTDLSTLLAGGRQRLVALSESWFPRHHYGWSELSAIQDGRFKLIRAPRMELYDLGQDPGETTNLAASDPERVAAMEATLLRLLGELRGTATNQAPQAIDAETTARLEALGYLGSSRGSNLEDDGRPRADPKDKIHLYNQLKEVGARVAATELDEAASLARAVLAEDPGIVEAHVILGNIERKAGRLDGAIAAYREALDRDPAYHEALFSLALAYKDQGRLEDALAGLDRAAELDPRNGKVIWQRADVLMQQGRFAEAETMLVGALSLELDRPRFLLKLGACYLELGRLDEATRRLREALAENPQLATAHFTLGLVAEARDRPGEAIAAYRLELANHPDAMRASFNLGKLLLAARQARAAVDAFRKTVEIQPAFGTGHLYLAKALLDAGDLAAAEAAAHAGLARQPEPTIAPLGHFVLADVYSRQGNEEKAAREAAAGQALREAALRKAPASTPGTG